MAYKKQNFYDGQVLEAEHLNHIEDGVNEAHNTIEKSIKYEYQNLTNTQKTQARSNIGALGQSDLESATNAALAKAKASGEFNGKDGEDGHTPVKGTDYFTETEKAEMVQSVIDALPKYNGEVVEV